MTNQVFATGMATRVFFFRFNGKYLVYSEQIGTLEGSSVSWHHEGVAIYQVQSDTGTYTLHQYFKSSDYEEGFGWEIYLDKDILLVSGYNNTYIFSENDGYFEETFALKEAYDRARISGRTVLAITRSDINKVRSISLEECTQAWPTETPTSAEPSYVSALTLPSSTPTISLAPTVTSAPSHVCENLSFFIFTTAATKEEGFEGEFISWKLHEQYSEEIILQGGPLEHNRTYVNNLTCLESGTYSYEMISSRGYGFGLCDAEATSGQLCATAFFYNGLNLFGVLNGALVGNAWYQEKFTFPIPLYEREEEGSLACVFDFYFLIYTGMDERGGKITEVF